MTKRTETSAPTVLVIGAYGLIGQGVVKRLVSDGCRVIGLGRDQQTAARVLPGVPFLAREMRMMTTAADWNGVLDRVTAVVNCSGALQDGPDDDLEQVQNHAVAALAAACATQGIMLVQISAVGATLDASTPFLASKARGDAAIKASGAVYVIFRPGLVLASNAYGGSTMLRMLAAFPLVQPIATPDAQIQTVALADVTAAISAAVHGKLAAPFEGDLVEAEAHPLRDIVAAMRHWLGFPAARFDVVLPSFCVTAISKLADGLARFGWRSPLRTTAVKVLADGVLGAPSDLTHAGVPPAKSLHETLQDMPVGVQDRLFARMALVTPLVLVTLCLFWMVSGVIGFVQVSQAANVLVRAGWSSTLAVASVVAFSVVDIAVGAAFAVRRFAKMACWAAIGVSLFYLVASTLIVPALWIDPLGPLVKVLPGILLALVARIALESR